MRGVRHRGVRLHGHLQAMARTHPLAISRGAGGVVRWWGGVTPVDGDSITSGSITIRRSSPPRRGLVVAVEAAACMLLLRRLLGQQAASSDAVMGRVCAPCPHVSVSEAGAPVDGKAGSVMRGRGGATAEKVSLPPGIHGYSFRMAGLLRRPAARSAGCLPSVCACSEHTPARTLLGAQCVGPNG
jgi:hypothetical protein